MNKPSPSIRNCQFEFECQQSWEDLEQTDAPDVRHCGECSKSVHLCTTDTDIARAIRDNLCVAIPAPKPRRNRKKGTGFGYKMGGLSRWPGPE
jgi:hypothetical protein